MCETMRGRKPTRSSRTRNTLRFWRLLPRLGIPPCDVTACSDSCGRSSMTRGPETRCPRPSISVDGNSARHQSLADLPRRSDSIRTVGLAICGSLTMRSRVRHSRRHWQSSRVANFWQAYISPMRPPGSTGLTANVGGCTVARWMRPRRWWIRTSSRATSLVQSTGRVACVSCIRLTSEARAVTWSCWIARAIVQVHCGSLVSSSRSCGVNSRHRRHLRPRHLLTSSVSEARRLPRCRRTQRRNLCASMSRPSLMLRLSRRRRMRSIIRRHHRARLITSPKRGAWRSGSASGSRPHYWCSPAACSSPVDLARRNQLPRHRRALSCLSPPPSQLNRAVWSLPRWLPTAFRPRFKYRRASWSLHLKTTQVTLRWPRWASWPLTCSARPCLAPASPRLSTHELESDRASASSVTTLLVAMIALLDWRAPPV